MSTPHQQSHTPQQGAHANRGWAKALRGAVVAGLIGVLAACSSGVKLDDTQGAPVEDRAGTAVNRDGGGTGNAGGASSNPVQNQNNDGRQVARVDATRTDPLTDPNSPLSLRSIYFDFDSFVIGDKFRAAVEAHAKYLLANKGKKVVIQGNADERGGSEYNLALGQKRAEAVRRALGLLGVPEAQVEAVSFGKEKPKALGHDEAAWAENRRADLVYQ